MKAADLRAMTVDQLDDEALKLKKEQFNLRFQRATGQLENTARVRAGASRHRADQDGRGAEARAPRSQSRGDSRDAEAHAAGRRRERQAGQDRGGARRAPLHPSGHEEDGAAVRRNTTPTTRRTSITVGDVVWIEERRPLSQLKRWEVIRGREEERSCERNARRIASAATERRAS